MTVKSRYNVKEISNYFIHTKYRHKIFLTIFRNTAAPQYLRKSDEATVNQLEETFSKLLMQKTTTIF